MGPIKLNGGAKPEGRGRHAGVYERQTRKPPKPRTFGEPQLHTIMPAVGAASQTAKWSAVLSAERRQYLLRHALELAFLIISGDPEQVVVGPGSTYLCRL